VYVPRATEYECIVLVVLAIQIPILDLDDPKQPTISSGRDPIGD
jgi:hypothetical protein